MDGTEGKPNRDELIRKIVEAYTRSGLEFDEALRSSRKCRTAEESAEEIRRLEALLVKVKSALARNDVSAGPCLADLATILEDSGHLDDMSSPADLVRISREALKQAIVQVQISIERARGNYDNAYDGYTTAKFWADPAPQPAAPPAAARPVESAPAITLEQAIRGYVNEQMTAKAWSAKTKLEYEVALKLLLDHFGNVPLAHLNHQKLLHFRDSVLKRLPSNREKSPKYRGTALADLLRLEIPESDRMLVNTQNKYLRRLSGLFMWAQRHQHLAANPAAGLQYKRQKRTDEERAAYSAENLQKLAEALAQLPSHTPPWRYWTPLVALYTGMRQNEIGQLHTADIVDKEGVPCFDVNERGEGKVLKSRAAKRLVPVHPHLVELGFLDYMATLKRKKAKRLWPELKQKRDGYGQRISRWYALWRKHWLSPADLKHKKDFHSFRHTFDNGLKQAGVLDVRLPQLMGHSLEKDQTFGRYGDMLRPPQLLDAIKKLDYGLDLTKLKRKWS